MIRVLIASLALAFALPFPAFAGAVAMAGDPNGPFYIVLTRDPCPADMLASVEPKHRSKFFFAKERFQGRDIRACWALNPPIVLIFDEDGDKGGMPMEQFRAVEGS